MDQAGNDSTDGDGHRIEGNFSQPVRVSRQQPAIQRPVPVDHVLTEQNDRRTVRLSRPQPGGVPEPKQPGNPRGQANQAEPDDQ